MKYFTIPLILFSFVLQSQDSLYTRKVIERLTSGKYFGRGYIKHGLHRAEKFLVRELKEHSIGPYLTEDYTQPFTHSVNTFPGRVKVRLNGKKLIPGTDYILDPASTGLKGKFSLVRQDSLTYTGTGKRGTVLLKKKKKLTYGVALRAGQLCTIELDEKRFTEEPATVKVKIRNKQQNAFMGENIIAAVEGTRTDTMVVFTAHYDHLGGMGRKTFFPGANDNASGVSMVLNLARHYAENPPPYRCLFIFFAGEEAGLLGSSFLVKSGVVDLTKIKFLINLDLLGTGGDGIMVVNGAIHEENFNKLVRINQAFDLVSDIRKRGKAANSDHYFFSEAGVPAFFIYTLGGITAYHDVHDTANNLPLTDYRDVFQLLLKYVEVL